MNLKFKLFVFLILQLFSCTTFSQSRTSKFFKLSTPEKCWVVFHPFKAKRAFYAMKDALKTTDSISKTYTIGDDLNGGQLDAFKHSYWMVRSCQSIGERASFKLGKAHEKGNYRSFKKGNKEDGFLPDKPSSEMDLFNNNVGLKIANEHPDQSKFEIILTLIDEIKAGSMKILKKDCIGNFLTCSGKVIPKDSLKGKWENEKCLIGSNNR